MNMYRQLKLYLLNTQIDGNHPKEVIFGEIDSILSQVLNDKEKKRKLGKPLQYLSAFCEFSLN
jgi:hypothetical protein